MTKNITEWNCTEMEALRAISECVFGKVKGRRDLTAGHSKTMGLVGGSLAVVAILANCGIATIRGYQSWSIAGSAK